jgi:hypothetical protein
MWPNFDGCDTFLFTELYKLNIVQNPSLKELWDIEIISIRKGCQLIVKTGQFKFIVSE